MAHHAHGTEINPLLSLDILHNILAQIPSPDTDTTTRMTEVCRHWWTVGHRYVWGQSFGQLRGLVLNVNDPARRAYFASLVKHVHVQPGDQILADSRTTLQQLEFPRLESVHLDLSNIEDMRAANIEALMVPSLRPFTLGKSNLAWHGDREADSVTLLNALMLRRASLRTLSLEFHTQLPESMGALLLELLKGTTAIEHLDLARVSGTALDSTSPVDLLHALLNNKQRLVSLRLPVQATFRKNEVDAFLNRVGPDWSMPSLRIMELSDGSRGTMFRLTRTPTSTLAAAQLLDRLPNLEQLSIRLLDRAEFWQVPSSGDNVKYILDSVSKLQHLKVLELEIDIDDCDLDGERLMQLDNLKDLESLLLWVRVPRSVLVTGVQILCLLNDLPKLKDLTLRLYTPRVVCSPDIKIAIEGALAKIGRVNNGEMTFVTQDPLQTTAQVPP
jgi:hypothetical protein